MPFNLEDSDLEDINEWLPSNSSDLLQLISDDEKVTSDSKDEDNETTVKVVKEKKNLFVGRKRPFKHMILAL